MLPQAHLTLTIFPIQLSHSINKRSPLNPFVELSHVKIYRLFMHHEKYPKFFLIHMKFKKRELNQIHKLKFSLFLGCL